MNTNVVFYFGTDEVGNKDFSEGSDCYEVRGVLDMRSTSVLMRGAAIESFGSQLRQ